MAIEVRNSRLRTILAFLLVFIFLPIPASASAGFVEAMSGAAYIKAFQKDKWELARKGDPLVAGDRVRTGPDGRALIRLSDGSKITIGNSSELEITAFLLQKKKRSGVFSLSTGKMRAVINRFSGSTDIKVKTPTSASGVKGTEFMVLSQGDANVLFGMESEVEVTGEGDRTVVLAPGTMTESTRGSDPIEPVEVPPGTPLYEARKELEAVTDVQAPVEWEKTGVLPNIIARWNINYASYLAESGRFREALDVLSIAIDLTETASVEAEAKAERANLLARGLKDLKGSFAAYMDIADNYTGTPYAGDALFMAGMVSMEMGEGETALRLFKKYLEQFPEGSHRETAVFFTGILESR